MQVFAGRQTDSVTFLAKALNIIDLKYFEIFGKLILLGRMGMKFFPRPELLLLKGTTVEVLHVLPGGPWSKYRLI